MLLWFSQCISPCGPRGLKDENRSSISPVYRKMRLNGAVSRNNRKKGDPVSVLWTSTLKKPTQCLWHWEPDRRFNYFNPSAHVFAVTYITEISLHVTLCNSLTHLQLLVSLCVCHTLTLWTWWETIEVSSMWILVNMEEQMNGINLKKPRSWEKNVFLKHYAPDGNKVRKRLFLAQRSLSLVSF